MEFDFSKVQEVASDIAEKAVQGVNYVAKKGKETYNRFTLENDLGKAQRQLGAYYYNQVKLGTDHTEAMAECVDRIEVILNTLNDLGATEEKAEETVEETKEGICPECGAVTEAGAVFCAKCGKKL